MLLMLDIVKQRSGHSKMLFNKANLNDDCTNNNSYRGFVAGCNSQLGDEESLDLVNCSKVQVLDRNRGVGGNRGVDIKKN